MLVTYRCRKKISSFDEIFKAVFEDKMIGSSPEFNITIPVETGDRRTEILTKYISNERYHALKNKIEQNIQVAHTTFRLPKQSGGYRTITAPLEESKIYLKELNKSILENTKVLTHQNSYAFTTKRNCKMALERHQKHESKYFLKIDIKDFFPSCTKDKFDSMMDNILNFALIQPDLRDILWNKVSVNGSLPQGFPTSPLLANLILLPFDHELAIAFSGFCITRYADDIIISSKFPISHDVKRAVYSMLRKHGFEPNTRKTRIGSINGRNWNLGLMLNKDNEITVGWRQKQLIKCKLAKFNSLEPREQSHWLGVLSYYKSIEPSYFTWLEAKYRAKFNW